MRNPPTSEQVQELRERVLQKTQAQIVALRKKSEAMASQVSVALPSIEVPKLNASHEDLVAKIQQKKRFRRIFLVLFIALLVFLMLQTCEQEQAVDAEPVPTSCIEIADCGPVRKKPKRSMRKKTGGVSIGKSSRSAMILPNAMQASWLPEFRLQVSARSVDLARCFRGRPQPGAFRFRATVFPDKGTISEPEVEAIADSSALSASETSCLVGALSNPTYRLKSDASDGLGQRVTIVFEF